MEVHENDMNENTYPEKPFLTSLAIIKEIMENGSCSEEKCAELRSSLEELHRHGKLPDILEDAETIFTKHMKMIKYTIMGQSKVLDVMNAEMQKFQKTLKFLSDCSPYEKDDNLSFEVTAGSVYQKLIGSNRSIMDRYLKEQIDYLPKTPSRSYAQLHTKDKSFQIEKDVIETHSPVLHKFVAEAEHDRVQLHHFNSVDLEDAIKIMRSGECEVNESNLQRMLELEQKFDMELIRRKCEEYIIATRKLSTSSEVIEALLIADKCKMTALLDVCVNKLALSDFSAIQQLEEYKAFNTNTRAALLDKLINLTK